MRITVAARWLGGLAIAAGLPVGAQVSSSAALGGGPGMGVAATFDAVLAPPSIGTFDFAVQGGFDRRRQANGVDDGVGRVESSVSRRWGADGATLGLGAERGTNLVGARVHPLLRANVWREMGRVVLSLGTEAHSARMGGLVGARHLETFAESAFNDTTRAWRHWIDSTRTGDSASASRALQWADVSARATWSSDRLTLDGRLGMQPKLAATPRTVWARATASIRLSPMLAFVAAGGTEPSRAWIGMPSSRFVSFGIRVGSAALFPSASPTAPSPPAPAAFSVVQVGELLHLLTLRQADAHIVEISGDFTGWRALPMRQTSADMWQLTLPLARGTHRVNVRIDGKSWIAPPGIASTTDEFNGSVGIIVVR